MSKNTIIGLGIAGSLLVCGIIGSAIPDDVNNATTNSIPVSLTQNVIENETSVNTIVENIINKEVFNEETINETIINEEITNKTVTNEEIVNETIVEESTNSEDDLIENKMENDVKNEIIKTETPKKENTTNTKNNSETVWIGKTGTKYHRESCRTLKGKGTSITLKKALSQGREPCKVCKP